MSNEDGGDRTPRRPGLSAIEVHQVSKRFGEVRAVHDVSFTIERGSICALLRANAVFICAFFADAFYIGENLGRERSTASALGHPPARKSLLPATSEQAGTP